jgi:hypothetical protein
MELNLTRNQSLWLRVVACCLGRSWVLLVIGGWYVEFLLLTTYNYNNLQQLTTCNSQLAPTTSDQNTYNLQRRITHYNLQLTSRKSREFEFRVPQAASRKPPTAKPQPADRFSFYVLSHSYGYPISHIPGL